MALAPASSRCSRWSADSARYWAASAAPLLVRQLLGVEPDAEAVVRGGLEQALDLVRGEGDGVAEGVDAGRELGLAASGISLSTISLT